MFMSISGQDKMQYIATIRLFRSLPERKLAEINRISTLTTVEKGYQFYYPEKTSEIVYILLRGRVSRYRLNPEGRKLVTAILSPQSILNAGSLLEDDAHHNFAEAMETCLVLMIRRRELRELVLSHPTMLMCVLEETYVRLNEVEEKLESFAYKPIPARIAEFLLRNAEQQGGNQVTGYTHQDIAESVGTYRETTTQTLSQLRSLGCIATGRGRIDILNAGQLAMTL